MVSTKKTLPKINVELEGGDVEEIRLLSPLNVFPPLKPGEKEGFRRYFWKEKFLVYEARARIEGKAEVNGKRGYEVIEEREGEGITAELRSYYVEEDSSWCLAGEIFRRSDGILRVNTALENGFPRLLKRGKPYISNGRRFELVGRTRLVIGGETYPCIKVTMKKEEEIQEQKGLIEFYLQEDGKLLFKANYHPREEYPTVSYEHSVIVGGEKFGIFHCSILASLLE